VFNKNDTINYLKNKKDTLSFLVTDITSSIT
jgi:hypothetical protein